WQMEKLGVSVADGPPLTEVVKAQRERAKTLKEMAQRSRYFYEDVQLSDEEKVAHFTTEIKGALTLLRDRLAELTDWSKEKIHEVVTSTAEKEGLKLGKLAQPLRIALTGGSVSPPIDVTILLVGRKRSLERLNRALSG